MRNTRPPRRIPAVRPPTGNRPATLPGLLMAITLAICLVVALTGCDLLFGINNITVKVANHTSATVTVWWSDEDEPGGVTVSPSSTSAIRTVRSTVAPLDFYFYARPVGGTRVSLKYVIGDGWNYTLGVYTAGSTYYLHMDNETR